MTHQICRVLDATLGKPEYQACKLVFYTSKEPSDITNAVFVLGAFLCSFLGATPEEAWQPFQGLDRRQCLPFRDATWVRSPYDLHVQDCWAGLVRALEHGMYCPLEFKHQEVLKHWLLRNFTKYVCMYVCISDHKTAPAAKGHCLTCAMRIMPATRGRITRAASDVLACGWAVPLLRLAGQWGHARPRAWSLLGFSGPA